jgi:hypothetical protein
VDDYRAITLLMLGFLLSVSTDFNFWGLHPVASVTMTCFGCAVNRNSFLFHFLLFTSLHVSASTGHHPQSTI